MKSDFEIIIDILQSNGSLTAREIAKSAKDYGKKWVRKDANSNLYKMLMQELVRKDSSEKVPKWSLTTVDPSKVRNEVTNSEQILNKVRKYSVQSLDHIVDEQNFEIKVKGVIIKYAYDLSATSNDPYMTVDWLQEKLFISVNSQHPFWEVFIDTPDEQLLYLQFLAQDALINWHVAKKGDEISSSSLSEVRDSVLREIALINLLNS
jgi:hypothetical protein